MMWRGAKGLLEIDGSCQWLKMWSKGGRGGGRGVNEEKVKNCFLVKQGQIQDFLSRVMVGNGSDK